MHFAGVVGFKRFDKRIRTGLDDPGAWRVSKQRLEQLFHTGFRHKRRVHPWRPVGQVIYLIRVRPSRFVLIPTIHIAPYARDRMIVNHDVQLMVMMLVCAKIRECLISTEVANWRKAEFFSSFVD